MDTNRIHHLLSKMFEVLNGKQEKTEIDADLMLDYTRVIYADLLELKKEWGSTHHATAHGHVTPSKVEIIEEKPEKEIIENEASGIVLEIPKINEEKLSPLEEQKETEFIEEVIVDEIVENTSDETAAAVDKKDLRKLIGINDRYLFMNELFNNDKFDYESVLDYINESPNYVQASRWLDSEYIKSGKWDKEDATVESFYNVVKSFFSKKK